MSIQSLLLVNALLALVWALLVGGNEPANLLVGAVVGFVVLTLYNVGYGRRMGRALGFAFYVLWQITRSSIAVSRAVLRPARHVRPGVVAVPLDASSPLEILLLASVITLTPGTISVETGHTTGDDASPARRVLFVHALTLDDPEALRTSIKNDLERRILAFTRPGPDELRQEV